MPQCQRSPNNTLLPQEDYEIGPGVVRCPGEPYAPGCRGGELYIALTAGPLVEYLNDSLAACAREFSVDREDDPTTLWLGARPMSVWYEDSGCHIYLTQGSNLRQYRYQIGHEACHRLIGSNLTHWLSEMLAELFTIFRLREAGEDAYATLVEDEARQLASSMSMPELHRWSGGVVGPELYARAMTTGMELVHHCGWNLTCRLAGFYDERGIPDASGWIDMLPEQLQPGALRILGLS